MDAPSIIFDVLDAGTDGLARFVSALSDAGGSEWECLFVCDRDQRASLDWLMDAGHVVLVPPPGAGRTARMNQAIALATGDPVMVVDASERLSSSEIGSIESFLRNQQGGIVLTSDSGDSAASAVGFAICRRAMDVLGGLNADVDEARVVDDYAARAFAANIPVGTRTAGSESFSRLEAVGAPTSGFADLFVAYQHGDAPLFEARCVWRDHKRRAPVRRLSVAFVTYDRLDYLQRTWAGLLEATPELETLECEFVFVDNGSDSNVREWLLERDAWLVFNPENRGIPIARNQALALATGDPVIMIDPDILLPAGWFGTALDVLTLPGIGFSAVSVESRTYEVMDVDGVDVEVKQGNIAGVWIIPRTTIDILGFFNEEYQFYGGEDSDYGHRIMVASMLNTYLPRMKGEHLGADDGVYSENRTEYVEMKAKWWDINMALFLRRAKEYETGERPVRVERVGFRS